jgi:hypothetical protein
MSTSPPWPGQSGASHYKYNYPCEHCPKYDYGQHQRSKVRTKTWEQCLGNGHDLVNYLYLRQRLCICLCIGHELVFSSSPVISLVINSWSPSSSSSATSLWILFIISCIRFLVSFSMQCHLNRIMFWIFGQNLYFCQAPSGICVYILYPNKIK